MDFCGGAYASTLYNCTLTGNSGSYGGGAYYSSLINCIVYFNTATAGGANCDPSSTLNYCCAALLPTNGVGNITNGPLFVDYSSANLRLQPNSPCINAGNNAYVFTAADLDGNPCIVGGWWTWVLMIIKHQSAKSPAPGCSNMACLSPQT